MQTPSTKHPFHVSTGVKPSLPILAREDAAGWETLTRNQTGMDGGNPWKPLTCSLPEKHANMFPGENQG